MEWWTKIVSFLPQHSRGKYVIQTVQSWRREEAIGWCWSWSFPHSNQGLTEGDRLAMASQLALIMINEVEIQERNRTQAVRSFNRAASIHYFFNTLINCERSNHEGSRNSIWSRLNRLLFLCWFHSYYVFCISISMALIRPWCCHFESACPVAMCILLCLVKAAVQGKPFWQIVQIYGFSLVCFLSCFAK